MPAIQAIVKGRVQGVGFRYFVQRQAIEIGVCGTVRNLPNRNVEVVAEGTQEQIAELNKALHKGPLLSRVTDVEITEINSENRFTEFSIIF